MAIGAGARVFEIMAFPRKRCDWTDGGTPLQYFISYVDVDSVNNI